MGTPPIALDIRPPAPTQGPLDLYKEGLSVQSMINQQALQKQAQQDNAVAMQQRELQLKQEQQAQQDQQTIRELAPKFSSKNANGQGTFDLDGLANEAQSRGINPQLINQMRMQQYQLQESASKAGTEKLNNELAHNKAAYEVIEGVKGITDPGQRQTAYSTGLNRLKLMSMDISHLPANAPDDKALEAYEASLGMHGQILSDAKTLAETNDKNAEAASKEWQKFPELGVMVNTKTGEQKSVAGPLMPPGLMEAKYVNIQQKKNQGQPLSAEDNAFAKGYEKYKTLVPVAQIGIQQRLLTPETQQALGQQFAQTGTLPAGMRSPAMTAQIMNAGVSQQPGVDIAANKMQYQADTGSLKNIQKTFDNVTAFENTAGKNLDVFLNQAKKVLDLGLPIANLPARMIANKLGSNDQAAFNAARTTALTEIAKVLSSANAGSGVLSDSARHEVEGLIGPDATLGQIVSAANILKQDMANRHEAYANQIQVIKQRGSGKPEGFTLPAGAKTATGPNGHKIAVVNGQWVDAQTGKPI